MTLIHYSKEPLTAVDSESNAGNVDHKPEGLWVSVDGPQDWKSWCESGGFASDRFVNETVIELRKDANVLRLSCAAEIDAFSAEYGVFSERLFRSRNIDWSKVAAKYQGIIIAPYCWARRLDDRSPWYYSWDCASGCIWDSSAVAALKPREVATGQKVAA